MEDTSIPVKRGFASDNNSGIHPEVLKAITNANQGHVVGYGNDPYTRRAEEVFKKQFGDHVSVYFVFNGTGANVLSLGAMTESFEAVLCTQTAHIQTDECGAPEKGTGCKLIAIPTSDGKLTVDSLKAHCRGWGDQHHVQPRVISFAQSTEMGTIYTPEEIKRLTAFAHKNSMLVHVDGARLSNAAASLGVSLKALTADCDIDALSFGGTKNGLMGGEAVVFFKKSLAENFLFRRKQSMQLASKMRFIAVQFEALLAGDLWLRNAHHANQMAQLLAGEVSGIPGVEITQKVQANGIFARLPKNIIEPLQKVRFFYVWNEEKSEVRWMTSFDTTEEDVKKFAAEIRNLV